MRIAVLTVSLALNTLALYVVFNPVTAHGPKMTCRQSTDERLNKQATTTFAQAHGGSLAETHDYLLSSDYTLRNINLESGTLVYTASVYPRSCGWWMFGIDGTIVRLKINVAVQPKIVSVY